MNDALAAVDLAFVRRDNHCSQPLTEAGGRDWLDELDYEPTPAPVDRWARGAVPTVAKVPVRANPRAVAAARKTLRRPFRQMQRPELLRPVSGHDA